jgi:hypothetical protein
MYVKTLGNNKVINSAEISSKDVGVGQPQWQLQESGIKFRVKTFSQLIVLLGASHCEQRQ